MILEKLMNKSMVGIWSRNIVSSNFSGDYEGALYDLNRLILNYKERETYYLRGIYRSRLFKSENYINFIEAINDFTEAIKITAGGSGLLAYFFLVPNLSEIVAKNHRQVFFVN